jgi:alpha-ketoglutarate-dependent taurine dioxygenase
MDVPASSDVDACYRTGHVEGASGPPDGVLPLCVQPRTDRSVAELAAWLTEHRASVSALLRRHGAILLRGFDVREAADFERLALAIEPELQAEYLGTSPRAGITRYTFSASELPGYYPIPQHCEMSFVAEPPRRLFFCCLRPPEAPGGETPLCDFRRVAAQLDHRVRQRFEAGGIRVIRNYASPDISPLRQRLDPWELKPWDAIFGTRDPKAVEAKSREQGFEPHWGRQGQLRLTSEHDAFRPHPETDEPVWFNHLQVFHLSTAPAELYRIWHHRHDRRALAMSAVTRVAVEAKRRLLPAEAQTMHCTYRDGTEIPDGDVAHVRDVIWQNMVIYPWRRGDIVAIDNRAVAHGRLPYTGPREVAVAWA